MEESVQEGFDDFGISVEKGAEEKIYKKCASICEKYSLNAEDFIASWMAFAASKSYEEVQLRWLEELEKLEMSKQKSKMDVDLTIVKVEKPSEASKVAVYGRIDDEDPNDDIEEEDAVLQMYGGNLGTPKVEKKPVVRRVQEMGATPKSGFSPKGYSPAVDAKSVAYAARTKAGDTVLRYKCKDSEYWNEKDNDLKPVGVKEVEFISQGSQQQDNKGKKKPFKFLLQKTVDLAAAFNTRIVSISKNMLEEDNEKDPQNLKETSVDDLWYLGRIRIEDGRMSQNSIFLEGDLELSDGHEVILDLNGAEDFRLFPGQVVLIKGKNELGKCLRVSEVCVPPPLPCPEINSGNTRPINVICASGPFTPIDSFKYEPLEDLLQVLARDRPDVCILSGPFVDSAHPLIIEGQIADTFEKVFEGLYLKLKEAVASLPTKIVIVSSYRDAHHFAVYPTPPFELEPTTPRDPKITILPDPGMFEVAGVTIGVTTVDVLKHLANTEVSRSTIATDRMGGLSKLVLSQRSFYPLYPPDESVPLDVLQSHKFCTFPVTPHVLIIPSDLRYFIKDVEGTIVINPERLTKGKSGGTYARFQVKLPDTLSPETVQSVADFCTGEILKI